MLSLCLRHCRLLRSPCTTPASKFCNVHIQKSSSEPRQGQQRALLAPAASGTATVPEPQVQQAAATEQQSQLPKSVMYCLVKNDEVLPCTMASGQWLESAPRGAYTTARSVGGGTSVFELSFHIQRLASTAALMMQADEEAAATAGAADPAGRSPAAAEAADPERLRPRVLSALRAAVRAYRDAGAGDPDGELKLTVLVTWAGGEAGAEPQGAAAESQNSADVFVHVAQLPPRPARPVRIYVRGEPRKNAAAKDSEWVRQRKSLERGMAQGVNETVLVGEGGALFEGLSSNFLAVHNGTVYTAGEGVLAGTVREVALAVARREGIPVVMEPPRLADLPAWEGCFISSTSRLLLPVDEVTVFAEEQPEAAEDAPAAAGGAFTHTFSRGGLVDRLERLVLDELVACSEPLFE